MGCGESKHDVATGNTITHRKKFNISFKKKKPLEAIPEADSKNFSPREPSELKPEQPTKNAGEDSGTGKVEAIADVKNIIVNIELKEEDIKELGKKDNLVDAVVEHEHGRTRDSPDHYFSSRKDEDVVEAIVAEEEGVEHFSSPPHEPSKEGASNESEKPENAVEEKALVDKEEEKRIETDKGKVVDLNPLKEENVVKEAKVAMIIEEKEMTTVDNKKNPVVVEEHKKDPFPQELQAK